MTLPCIKRTYHGGVERITLAEFTEYVVQDDQVGLEVAKNLLASKDGEYQWNPDEPEFYELFEVYDRAELVRQIEAADE